MYIYNYSSGVSIQFKGRDKINILDLLSSSIRFNKINTNIILL